MEGIRLIKIWAVVISALFIYNFQVISNVFAASPDRVGLWVVRDEMASKEKINRVIDFAVKNGVSDLFVQIRGRGNAFYQSKIVPRALIIQGKNFDPLKYTLSKAHSEGLKVHAWFNVFLLWTSEKPPRVKNHLLYLHPDWCTVDANGVKDIDRPFEDFKSNGSEGIYLSPLHPEVHSYLFSIIYELVNNYDIDGLHFDYIRYPNKMYDYHKSGRLEYKKKTGVDPILLSISNKSFFSGWDAEDLDRLIDEWKQFRCDAISSLIQSTKGIILISGKSIIFSAAVKADPVYARNFFYQDWVSWVNNEWLDFVVPMNYSKSSDEFENILKKIKRVVQKNKIWMGIAVYNQSRYDALTKTILSLYNGYDNIVYFSYRTFAENPKYYSVLRKAFQIAY